jgi:hypothetical protein
MVNRDDRHSEGGGNVTVLAQTFASNVTCRIAGHLQVNSRVVLRALDRD